MMGTCQVWLSDGDGRVQPARGPAPRSLYILALCLNCIRGLCHPVTLSTVKIKLDALKSKPIFCRCQLSVLPARLDLTQLPIYRRHDSTLWWAELRLGQLHFWPVRSCHLWCWQTATVMPLPHASPLTRVRRRDWIHWIERLVVVLIRSPRYFLGLALALPRADLSSSPKMSWSATILSKVLLMFEAKVANIDSFHSQNFDRRLLDVCTISFEGPILNPFVDLYFSIPYSSGTP